MEVCGFLLVLLLHYSSAVLELFAPSPQSARIGSDALLTCTFSVDNPPVNLKFLNIIWQFQDKEIIKYKGDGVKGKPGVSLDVHAAGNGVASLSITEVKIPSGGIYKCIVIYSPVRQEKEIRLDVQAPPEVTIRDNVVIQDKESLICCSATGFYPVDIDLTWLRNGDVLPGKLLTPQRNSDGTYRTNNTVTIIPTEENRNQIFTCRVQHQSLSQPLQKDFKLTYGVPPKMEIHFEKFQLNLKQTLMCEVWGFYPESIAVNWYVNGIRVEMATIQRKNSSYVVSIYQFRPTREIRGSKISCKVEHNALSSPIEKVLLVEFEGKMFYPEDIQIRWTNNLGEVTHREGFTQDPSDFTFSLLSECKIPADLFKDSASKVCVTWDHKSMDGPESREMLATDLPWHPEIGDFAISQLVDNKPGTLQCHILRFFPDALTVTWYRKEKGSQEMIQVSDGGRYKIPDIRSQRQPDNTYTCTACLGITPSLSSDQGAEFICRVEHPSLTGPIERSSGALQVTALPQVSESIIPALCDSGHLVLTLNLQRFYPRDIQIRWTNNLGEVRHTISEDSSGVTFSVQSEYKIPSDYFKNPTSKVCVTWEHQSMDDPESRDITATDLSWRPEIGNISIPKLVDKKPVTLQCQIFKFFPDALTVTWYRRKKRSQEMIQVSDGERYQIPAIRSQKQPDNTYTCTACLGITPSLSSDQGAEFICRVGHPSLTGPIERSSGELQVTAVPQISGSIDPSRCDSGDVIFTLRLQRFYPKDIKITWTNSRGEQKDAKTLLESTSDLFYSVQSQCKIPADYFRDPTSRVRVTWHHISMDNTEYREMSATDLPWQPKVGEVSIPKLVDNKQVTLECDISKFFPNILSVTWFKKEKGNRDMIQASNVERCKIKVIRSQKQRDNTYTCTACLGITPSLSSDQGAEFICRVGHPSLKEPIERSSGELQITAVPQISGSIEPSCCDSGDVIFTLRLHRFYPKDIKITWTNSLGEQKDAKTLHESTSDLFYSVQSECKILADYFRDPTSRVRVTWHHISMDNTEYREMSATDLPWHPQVGKISIPKLVDNKQVTLECDISKFFPDILSVTWFKKMKGNNEMIQVSDGGRYTPDTPQKQPDNTYTCTACLGITPSLSSDQGAEFICRVEHPSLKQPIERRSGELQITGISMTNKPEEKGETAQRENPMIASEQGTEGRSGKVMCAESHGHGNVSEDLVNSEAEQDTDQGRREE
ncbi:uncharacterized protein O3C94_018988 [Discoglossus pictus]